MVKIKTCSGLAIAAALVLPLPQNILIKYQIMKRPVKFFTLLFFLSLNFFVLNAQQKHFIYVQSEDRQQFAVILNGKVYSSSDYGYVIIPKLTDGNYNFTVSFPMNKFPEQNFSYSINKKDAGFILKNSTDGWTLENMQTQKLVMNSTAAVAQKNAFGNMLSDVVNDADLTKKNMPAKTLDSVKTFTDTITSIVPTDTVAKNNTGYITDSILTQPQKISEQKLDTGINILFVDKTLTGNDTINAFIPADILNANLTLKQKSLSDTAVNNNSIVVSSGENNETFLPVDTMQLQKQDELVASSSVINNQPKEELNPADTTTHVTANPFYKPQQNDNTISNAATNQINNITINNTSNAVKENCSSMISDADIDKLKRKMFVQNNINNMIQYAVKNLNKKCISTAQVKELGNLFSSDDGRYSLYDALYNYVYDYGNYVLLSTQILDPYYKKRFAALLR